MRRTIVSLAVVGLLAFDIQAQTPPRGLVVSLHGPNVCLLSQPFNAEFYLYNRSDAPQVFRGEPVDAEGKLVLSGAWDLVLEEVKEGAVFSSHSLRPEPRAEGPRDELKQNGYRNWKWTILAGQLANHPGNYRFRVSVGEASSTTRIFRLVKSLDTPDWVSLTYTTDKRSYFIGEPIRLFFVLKNNGTDDFAFHEGGDYRGATRHLRHAFTAATADGVAASDPTPVQHCMGGKGMAGPTLSPGKTYEKKLDLLAYLHFSKPGRYTVKGYHELGFGKPATDTEIVEPRQYAYGGSFEIELREPTEAEMAQLLSTLLQQHDTYDTYERERGFSNLHDERYLQPLEKLLAAAADDNAKPIIAGIASIRTLKATKLLMTCATDPRTSVRLAVLSAFPSRIPSTWELQRVKTEKKYIREAKLQLADKQRGWDEQLRPELVAIALKGLESKTAEEVQLAANCLATFGGLDSLEPLAFAADRVAPAEPLTAEAVQRARQLASSAWTQAAYSVPTGGMKLCRADKDSSPGRLAVWASGQYFLKQYQTPEAEELLLQMLNSNSSFVQSAAVHCLPPGFVQRHAMPWRALLAQSDRDVWWYAMETLRTAPDPNAAALLKEALQAATDTAKRSELSRVIEEFEARAKKQ